MNRPPSALWSTSLFILAASCGPDDQRPGSATGGASVGGETATGGASAGGQPGAGGSEATGAAGSGGIPAATGGASLGGSTTGGDGAALSSNSDIAAAIQRHDVACEAACTLALQCQPVLETVEECQNIFLCLELAFRVDASDVSPAAMLECLDAATAHMQCVSGLTCDEYYGWWNENVDPFACSSEQGREEMACAETALFYDPNS